MGPVDAANVLDEQTAGHHARAENNHRGQDDFPGVHRTASAAGSWSTAASTVFSNSWDRSLEGVLPAGAKNDQALSSSMIATQGAAAHHNPRAHTAQRSVTGHAPSRAMMRCSNAYGTRSLGGLARAAAISLRLSSATFIEPAFFWT